MATKRHQQLQFCGFAGKAYDSKLDYDVIFLD